MIAPSLLENTQPATPLLFMILISRLKFPWAIREYSSPVDESFRNIVPLSAPIVEVVIFTSVSSASSKLLVLARSVVTWSSMSENLEVLFLDSWVFVLVAIVFF
jgi:hypothetical protein